MIKPKDDNVYRAILNLEGNVSWEEIVDWLRVSLFEQSLRNNRKTGEDTIKGQGRCLELEDILETIKNAREYLKKKE